MTAPAAGAEATPGHVTRLLTTPVKGFSMQESSALLLTGTGVAGDRAFFLVDDDDRLVSATRTACFLPYWAQLDAQRGVLGIGRGDDVVLTEEVVTGEPVRAHFFGDRYATGHVVGGAWSRVLSEIAGQPLRLVRASDPLGGYDVHRVSLVSESSVSALQPEPDAAPLDSRRFRMTITISGVPPFTEETWTDRLLRVGESLVRIEVPVRRCAAVQKHPQGLESHVDPLRRIKDVRGATTSAAGRGLHLGVYGEVVQPGLVQLGDVVAPR